MQVHIPVPSRWRARWSASRPPSPNPRSQGTEPVLVKGLYGVLNTSHKLVTSIWGSCNIKTHFIHFCSVLAQKFITYYRKFEIILQVILLSFKYKKKKKKKSNQYDMNHETYDSIYKMSQRRIRWRKSPQSYTQNSAKWTILEVSPREKDKFYRTHISHTL